jgi:hypothetical protein
MRSLHCSYHYTPELSKIANKILKMFPTNGKLMRAVDTVSPQTQICVKITTASSGVLGTLSLEAVAVF